jgi:hypothetical protein
VAQFFAKRVLASASLCDPFGNGEPEEWAASDSRKTKPAAVTVKNPTCVIVLMSVPVLKESKVATESQRRGSIRINQKCPHILALFASPIRVCVSLWRSVFIKLLELKLCAESDRTVSKIVQVLTEVSAVQTINRNPVIVLIESIQEVSAQDELACLVELDVL